MEWEEEQWAGQEEELGPEEQAEMEAMLYSQLHYDHGDNSVVETVVAEGGYETPGGDSGYSCGPSRPESPASSETDYCSRYTAAASGKVENPFYNSDSADSESDCGIILVGDTVQPSPPTILLSSDSDTAASPITISDEDVEALQETREPGSNNSRKNDRKLIKKTLKARRKRREHYKADFGSDFSDNFGSEDSDCQVEEVRTGSEDLVLNVVGGGGRGGTADSVLEAEHRAAALCGPVEVPAGWSQDMVEFYNNVDPRWLECGDLETLQASLPTTGWQVDRSDLYTSTNRRRYFTGKKCNNCGQPGHLARDCGEPAREERCGMCGAGGHGAGRCPGRCCLQCGQPGGAWHTSCSHCRRLAHIACRECQWPGHVARDCPDRWRRYHATVQPGPPARPGCSEVHRPARDRWCSNCGSRGHLADSCRKESYSSYPLSSLLVTGYNKTSTEFQPDSPPSRPFSSPAANQPNQHIRLPAFASSPLLENAMNKLEKVKGKGKWKKTDEKLKNQITKLLNAGKNKKQIVWEIMGQAQSRFQREEEAADQLNRRAPKKPMRAKIIKDAVTECIESQKSEARRKEWTDQRGFGKSKQCKPPVVSNSKNKSEKNLFKSKTSKADLIPTDVKAARKFLKKEVGRVARDTPLSKQFRQEIFGLKALHPSPLLKKVERKRLADLVLQLRQSQP